MAYGGNFLLRVPQVVGLHCALASRGNFQNAHYKTFPQLATITRVSYFRLRPLDAEETCVGNSKGAAAVVGNAGNNAAGLPAGHTDTSGRGSGSRVAVVIVGSRSRKMGRSAKGKNCVRKLHRGCRRVDI